MRLPWMAIVGLLGCSCAPRLSDAELFRIDKAACPSMHEIERVRPITVAMLSGTLLVEEGDGRSQPLPGGTLHLTGTDSADGRKYVRQSGDDGTFSFGAVPSGAYRLTVCREGFVTLGARVVISERAVAGSVTLVTRLDW